MNTFFKDIVVLLSSGIYGYIVLHFLMTSKQNYIRNYKKVSIGFIQAIIVSITLYFSYYLFYFQHFNFDVLLILFPFLVLISIVYFLLHKLTDSSSRNYFEKRKMYFVAFDPRFVISMSFNLLWQQLGLLFLFEIFSNMRIPFAWIVLIFPIIVGISHLYIFKNGRFLGFYFLFATVLAGILFPIAMVYIPNAFLYSYMFHWTFYAISGILFYQLRRKKINFHLIR